VAVATSDRNRKIKPITLAKTPWDKKENKK